MKTINYKGKGEHSVNELELIIEQQAEELHLLKSGQKQLPINGVTQQSKLLRDYSEYLDTYRGFLHGKDRTEVAEKWLSRNSG